MCFYWSYDRTGTTLNWTRNSGPTNLFCGRHVFAFEHHVPSNDLLLYGGSTLSAARYQDTWRLDLGTKSPPWKHDPMAPPGPGSSMGVAYHPADDVMVIFGGNSSGNDHVATTWTWDGTDWTQIALTGPQPAARSSPAMAYLPGEGVVLFGGETFGNQYLCDTWILDDSTRRWRHVPTATHPNARNAAALLLE
ncbi:MAG: kelch repeat-containing protein [Deltaproteobacteria bacterium]